MGGELSKFQQLQILFGLNFIVEVFSKKDYISDKNFRMSNKEIK